MLIFFDETYVDLSVKTRWFRQVNQFRKWRQLFTSSINIYGKILYIKWLVRSCKNFFKPKIKVNPLYYNMGEGHRPNYRNDPTIDQEINNKGGIYSHLDNKVYTNKHNYLDSIKRAGCHIKDY